ncbi:hypothetical protein AAFN46_03015 [Pseudomonas sp. CAU 1711]|uniref:hypothetical protein n=1 Tax=Pseudomonas sp. CAU 1711 TaxID=3140356 RepID=UPI003260BB1A
MRWLRLLLGVLIMTLAACASDPVRVSSQTWRQVDAEIACASRAAEAQARQHALEAMGRWLVLVQRQTDEEFIPWFSGYWTQQWLGLRVSWYRLGSDDSVQRLAAYLQEEYQEQVLEPVAEDISPERIQRGATKIYVRQLDMRLQGIAARHGVPQRQFERRLQALPAIAGTPGASLHQLLRADPLERLPAYAALLERVRPVPGGDWSSDPGISLVAQRTSERLIGEMAAGGAASAIGAAVGGAAGTALSLGVGLFTAIVRSNDRPRSEAQLRLSLQATLEQESQALLRSRERGVLAGVWQLSGQIERSLGRPFDYRP